MTIDELKQHPLFKQITTKQQTFLLVYLQSSGNIIKAAHAAFKVGSDANADFMGRRVLKMPIVRKLLSEFNGYDMSAYAVSKSELINLISQRLRSGTLNDREFGNLTERLMFLKGWNVPTKTDRAHVYLAKQIQKEATATEVEVDDLVRKLEKGE